MMALRVPGFPGFANFWLPSKNTCLILFTCLLFHSRFTRLTLGSTFKSSRVTLTALSFDDRPGLGPPSMLTKMSKNCLRSSMVRTRKPGSASLGTRSSSSNHSCTSGVKGTRVSLYVASFPSSESPLSEETTGSWGLGWIAAFLFPLTSFDESWIGCGYSSLLLVSAGSSEGSSEGCVLMPARYAFAMLLRCTSWRRHFLWWRGASEAGVCRRDIPACRSFPLGRGCSDTAAQCPALRFVATQL